MARCNCAQWCRKCANGKCDCTCDEPQWHDNPAPTTPETPLPVALPEAALRKGWPLISDCMRHNYYTADQMIAYAKAYAAEALRGRERDRKDAERMDHIASEYWTLEPFDMPTGQGDADVGWRVFQYQGRERKLIADHYFDDPRAALDAAMAGEKK